MNSSINLKNEITSYAKDNLKIKIGPINITSGKNLNWKPGDKGNFTIQISNLGDKDVTNFRLNLNSNYGKILYWEPWMTETSNWSKQLEIPYTVNIPAHATTTTWLLQYKAERSTRGEEKRILMVNVKEYDLSGHHVKVKHNGYDWTGDEVKALISGK